MKDTHVVGKKWSDVVVTWPFISCYFLGIRRTRTQAQATSEAINFEPFKIKTCSAPQNDLLNLSFVKDKHIYGKKVARNGRTTVIYEGHSFRNGVYFAF